MSDRARIFSDQVMKKDDIFDDEFEMEKEEMSFETDIPVKAKEIPAAAPGMLQMKVVRPKKLSEATAIADSLRAGQTIVLNLDEMTDMAARRILDYIAGVIYAINGKIERPSDRTFLLTPAGVRVATQED